MENIDQIKQGLADSINNMTDQEKLELKAKILGFRSVPVGIDEFIESDLYLGKSTRNGAMIYPFWREFLRELYPDPLTCTNQILILTGGIGIGKSTLSLVMCMYTLYKILLLKDTAFFDIELMKGVNIVFFHVNVDKANSDFVFPMYSKYIENSPWFQKNKRNQRFVVIPEGPMRNKGIGGDVVYYNLSEINFINHDKAVEKVNSAISRFYSRWRSAIGYFGHVVLDSSVFGDASVVEQVIAESPYDIKVVRAPIWKVKAHTGQFSKTTFKVFTGDAINQPFIVTDITKTYGLDPDKIIEVPDNLLPEYKSDIFKGLQETAGVSTSMTGKYFTDINKLNYSFNLPWDLNDTFVVDFFDPEDQLWNYLHHLFEGENPVIPYDKLIAIRFDCAYSGDLAGVAVGYLKEMRCINPDIGLYEPVIDTPVIFGVSRKPGQETALSKLKQFVYDLNQIYDIGVVTMDSFQSKNIQQDLVRDGFKSYFLSMDRNNQAYDLCKSMIYEGRFNQANNKLHKRDMINLRIIGNKVDHLPIYSKDTCDAACGICKSILDNLELFKQVSQKYALEATTELYQKLYNKEPVVQQLENRIKGLFK